MPPPDLAFFCIYKGCPDRLSASRLEKHWKRPSQLSHLARGNLTVWVFYDYPLCGLLSIETAISSKRFPLFVSPRSQPQAFQVEAFRELQQVWVVRGLE